MPTKNPATLFPIEKARELVRELTRTEEDGWTYIVASIPAHATYVPTTTAKVEVYDADDVFVGHL